MVYKHPLEVPRSEKLACIEWLDDRISCKTAGLHGDTYPVAWSDDENLYIGTGDPGYLVEGGRCKPYTFPQALADSDVYRNIYGVAVEMLTGKGETFDVWRINDMTGLIGPGGYGPKPTGMISVDGKLYLAVQNLLGFKKPRFGEFSQHGSDATILRSDDHGLSWTPDIQPMWIKFESEQYDREQWKWLTPERERAEYKGWKPMFYGPLFGGPSFVQFGRDNSEAKDNYIYAVSADQWDNGSELRLGRVNKDRILDADSWEFAVAGEDGEADWIHGLENSGPVLTINRHISVPEVVYLPSLNKYLLLTWALHKDFDATQGSELTILESDKLWGPWKLVHYEWMWDSREVCPYCPHIPLKWFDEKSLSGWMLYSGNWHENYWYRPHVRQFRLILR